MTKRGQSLSMGSRRRRRPSRPSTSSRTDFPKTHDLARRVDLLPASTAVPASADDLEWLSYFGTAGRYVIDDVMAGSEPGWEDAAQAFHLAEEILDWAKDAAERQG